MRTTTSAEEHKGREVLSAAFTDNFLTPTIRKRLNDNLLKHATVKPNISNRWGASHSFMSVSLRERVEKLKENDSKKSTVTSERPYATSGTAKPSGNTWSVPSARKIPSTLAPNGISDKVASNGKETPAVPQLHPTHREEEPKKNSSRIEPQKTVLPFATGRQQTEKRLLTFPISVEADKHNKSLNLTNDKHVLNEPESLLFDEEAPVMVTDSLHSSKLKGAGKDQRKAYSKNCKGKLQEKSKKHLEKPKNAIASTVFNSSSSEAAVVGTDSFSINKVSSKHRVQNEPDSSVQKPMHLDTRYTFEKKETQSLKSTATKRIRQRAAQPQNGKAPKQLLQQNDLVDSGTDTSRQPQSDREVTDEVNPKAHTEKHRMSRKRIKIAGSFQDIGFEDAEGDLAASNKRKRMHKSNHESHIRRNDKLRPIEKVVSSKRNTLHLKPTANRVEASKATTVAESSENDSATVGYRSNNSSTFIARKAKNNLLKKKTTNSDGAYPTKKATVRSSLQKGNSSSAVSNSMVATNSNLSASDIQPLDTLFFTNSQLCKVSAAAADNVEPGVTCALVYMAAQKPGSSMGLVEMTPKTQYGPVINDRGFLSCLITNCESKKLKFDSGVREGNPVKCQAGMQIIIAPKDIYGFKNESATVACRILVICCKAFGSLFNAFEHIDSIDGSEEDGLEFSLMSKGNKTSAPPHFSAEEELSDYESDIYEHSFHNLENNQNSRNHTHDSQKSSSKENKLHEQGKRRKKRKKRYYI